MVRMSDLARGGGAPTPPRKTEPAPDEPRRVATAVPPAAPAAPRAPSAPPAPPPRPRLSSLYTQTRAADVPVVPVPGEPSSAPASPDVADTADRILGDLQQFLERVPDLLKTGEPLPWGALERIVERAVRSLETSSELFWLANGVLVPKGTDHLAFHQTRVAIVAIRIGMTIGYERRRLVELGLAASLIDIGLWQLPAGLLRRLDALTSEEEHQYQAHPRVAAEHLRRWAPPFEGLADIVLQHHEREQGQGFPQGLHGAAVRVEAKIIGLADTYLALTAPPSLRPGLPPHEAVREIVRSKHDTFPSELVKALLSDITVFPPGTVVRLNTGEIGSVVAVNRNHPLRPRVEIVDGKSGPLATPKIVDLSEAPFLYITGPVSETAR
jgi:HD-GYP domain-containing protein (c-di-GMP phosphodiesterase class II)